MPNRRPKVVFTDPFWAIDHSGQLDPKRADVEKAILGDQIEIAFGIHENGHFVTEGSRYYELLREATALVIYRARITDEIVKIVQSNCKVIARQGVGFDNLNVPLLKQNGIFGFNVPDYCVDEVTSHTMALVLALERGLCIQNERLKAGHWNIFEGGFPRRLNELTFGIVGFGRIGRATSRKAEAFYRRIIAYDPFVHHDLMNGYGVCKCQLLMDFLREADVVVLHPVLDETTKFLINCETLGAFKPSTLLVNTARGDLVEPSAVLEALKSGRLGGYGSDVFNPEDPHVHPINKQILTFPNVVVTSHRAFLSRQAERSQRVRVAEEIRRVLLEGVPPMFGRLA